MRLNVVVRLGSFPLPPIQHVATCSTDGLQLRGRRQVCAVVLVGVLLLKGLRSTQ
jgi:hypothetical protein